MALDGIFLSIVKKELSQLIGGRVDKIYQPSREEIVFAIRTREGSFKLLFNASAKDARVHITKAQIENPKTPPMFCMLMRKHLSSGKLCDIRQDGSERVLFFDFESVNEMGDLCKLTVAMEIMGRCSNLVLIAENGKIIDCIKRVGFDLSSVRPVLPGMIYEPVPRQDKLSLFEIDRETLCAKLSEQGAKPLSKGLVNIIEGISPIFAREAQNYAAKGELPCSELSEDTLDKLCFYLSRTANSIENGTNKLTVVKTRDGDLKDFCFTEILQYGSLMVTSEAESACEVLDFFYTERDVSARRKQKAADLFKLLISTTERISRRIAVQKQELEDCRKRDEYKLCGDLLMANLYRIQKGDTKATVENFYDEGMPTIEIKLDSRLTPSQNAQKYYNDYRKADTAEKKLCELIKQGEQELWYIDSVFDSLTRATTEDEISVLREELAEEGYIRKSAAKAKAARSPKPYEFVSSDGFKILVGRNNRQNDKLTLKDSEKSDIWLHTHNIAGSHTVIVCGGKEPPMTTIEQAARLAALHSKAKSSSQVPVDYTQIRYVKKPSGAKPGMVIFTNNKTLYVTPDEQEANNLKS